MTPPSTLSPRISIGTVARRTGLSTHVIRAWERRYDVVKPKRTDGGARVYSHEDVLRLQLLKRLTEQGHAIGQIADLSSVQLVAILRDDEIESAVAKVEAEPTEAGRFLAEALEAAQSLDGPRVHQALMRAVVALKSAEFVNELVLPLLSRVGELWATEAICPVHEHVLSVNLRRVLAWVIDSVPANDDAPVFLCTTPAHQRHELGAMLSGITASEEQWRVAYLGPDLPAEDIALGAKTTGASVVALSIVHARDKEALRHEVKKIRSLLPKGVVLVAGGAGTRNANLEKAGALVLSGLDDLRNFLRSPDTRRKS